LETINPTPHGVVERAREDLMDFEDGLGVEATAADMVAIGRECGVEPFDVVWPKVPKRDAADAGDDVQPDVAVIAGPGGWPQPSLVGREPSLGQVDADGEAGATRRTIAQPVVGEAMGEFFGKLAIGARGVSATALAAGDRVEAFVDDGVVLVPLADDVALH
jgi:hypothetical protein